MNKTIVGFLFAGSVAIAGLVLIFVATREVPETENKVATFSVSKAESRGKAAGRAMSSLHDVQPLSLIQANAVRSVGDARLDAEKAAVHAYTLCNAGRMYGAGSFAEAAIKGGLPSDVKSQLSHFILDQARAKVCGKDTDMQPLSQSKPWDEVLLAVASQGSDAAKKVLLAKDALYEGKLESPEVVAQDAVNVLVTTDSPALFVEAGSLLAHEELDSVSVPKWERGRIPGVDEVSAAKLAGVYIASCRIFGWCADNDLLALNVCMPNLCRPGGRLTDYIEAKLTPAQWEAANSYADGLIALRQGR